MHLYLRCSYRSHTKQHSELMNQSLIETSLQDKTGTTLLSGFKINVTDLSSDNEGDFIVLDTST